MQSHWWDSALVIVIQYFFRLSPQIGGIWQHYLFTVVPQCYADLWKCVTNLDIAYMDFTRLEVITFQELQPDHLEPEQPCLSQIISGLHITRPMDPPHLTLDSPGWRTPSRSSNTAVLLQYTFITFSGTHVKIMTV